MQLHPRREQTLAGAAEALHCGQTTCRQLVEQCLRRIDEFEQQIHAWVSVDRAEALDRADACDRERHSGRDRGPLHGIPIGIKDLIDVAGRPTGCGSARESQRIASADAPLVARLRDAGAILIGKTVTTQFACFDPPLTRNPWNLERTPGGSSSGSAAAVAAGMCLGAIGSQTGGSITRPASFCGVAGLKPTFGRIPMEGVYPVSKSLDHPGPIARTVGDLAILYAVLTGTPVATGRASPPPRLGRLRGMFDELAVPEMRSSLDAAVEALSAGGAPLADAGLPAGFDDVLQRHRQVMLFELGEVHRDRFAAWPEDYLPGLRGLMEESRQIAPALYAEARRHQDRLRKDISASFADADVLICPATPGPAPDPSTTGNASFNAPWSYTGLPTVSFPIGLTPDGLPLAIQLVGRHDDEASLIAAALWCEEALGK